jgi:hypothetical protein
MPIEQEPDATNSFGKTAIFRFFWPGEKNSKNPFEDEQKEKCKNAETQPETVSFFATTLICTIVHPPSPLRGIGSRDRLKTF